MSVLDGLGQDVRHAARTLGRNKLINSVAVLSLTLATGANMAVVAVLDTALFRRLSIPEPDGLLLVHFRGNGEPQWTALTPFPGCEELRLAPHDGCSTSYPIYEGLRDELPLSLRGIAAFTVPERVQVVFRGEGALADAQFVSDNFFQVLGVGAERGRVFLQGDAAALGEPVAVLSERYWRGIFGSDASIVGETIAVNGVALTIVGVAARSFLGLDAARMPGLWIPLETGARLKRSVSAPKLLGESSATLALVTRLSPGARSVRAGEQLQDSLRRILAENPQQPFKVPTDVGITLTSLARGLNGVRTRYARPLGMLRWLVGLVVIVACANVANLLLVRASARRKEIALRVAIGAGWQQILRHLLVEGLVIALLGIGLGVIVGLVVSRGLALILVPTLEPAALAWSWPGRSVFTLAAITTAVAVLVFAVIPAWAGRRIEPARDLQTDGQLGGGARLMSVPGSLVGKFVATAEVAVAVVLLVGAGLLVRSVVKLATFDPGFRTDHLLSFSVAPMLTGDKPPKLGDFAEAIRSRLLDLPGVTSATWSGEPLLAQRWQSSGLILGEDDGARIEMIDWLPVGPAFFETLDMRLVSGRAVEVTDCRDDARVVWVNERFVDLYLRDREALGAPVRFSSGSGRYQIAGVARDSRYARLRDAVRPTVFVPNRSDAHQFVVRTSFEPSQLARGVVNAARQVSPLLIVHDVKDLRKNLDGQIGEERLLAQASIAFGGLAVILAAVGVYGVLSASVARRTSELAVRISLGAAPSNIFALIMREGAEVAVMGCAVGIAGAFWLSRLIAAVLFGVGPLDTVSYVAGTALVAGIVALASFVPAWRATRVDPLAALRGET